MVAAEVLGLFGNHEQRVRYGLARLGCDKRVTEAASPI
jgi:hypothetical protein